jgi:uncharacterized protein YkwD
MNKRPILERSRDRAPSGARFRRWVGVAALACGLGLAACGGSTDDATAADPAEGQVTDGNQTEAGEPTGAAASPPVMSVVAFDGPATVPGTDGQPTEGEATDDQTSMTDADGSAANPDSATSAPPATEVEDTTTTTTAAPATTTTTAATTTTVAPAPPADDPPPEPSTPDQAALEQRVVELTNAERAAAGCAPLGVDQRLGAAARAHSADMADQDYFSHTGANGSSVQSRVEAQGYAWRRLAENIAFGYPTPEAVVAGWMDSEGHRANILNCELTQIGVGYDRSYWTQNFGTPR